MLVDCGLPFKAVRARLRELGLTPDDLDAVFITHEHGDHIGGLASLLRRTQVDVFMSSGTAWAAGWHDLPGLNLLRDREVTPYRDLQIEPVIVPHDAREPCQFVISAAQGGDLGQRRLGVLTDLGSPSPHIVDAYQQCDALVLECNHDTLMLREGPYPPGLKARVGGDWGHLSNDQATGLLEAIGVSELQWLALAHISEQNNSLQLARESIRQVFADGHRTVVASQEAGFDWLTVE